jgi:phenylacetate-CoA ligase
MDLSIIIPCYNEEGNIHPLVSEIQECFGAQSISFEMVFIDDGSSDRTFDEIHECQKSHENIISVRHETNRGISECWATGLAHAAGIYIVTTDADRQYQTTDILRLYDTIREHKCDLVYGWRKKYMTSNITRIFLSRALSLLLNIVFLTRLHDIKSGFVIYRKGVAADIFEDRHFFKTFQHFFLVCALSRGYTINHIPVTFVERQHGTSFIRHPLSFSMKVIADIPAAFSRYKHKTKKSEHDRG